MDLREYIDAFPREERMEIRSMIAYAHGVSEVTVRAWANGTRKHPCSMSALDITEAATGGRVTRQRLRPDIFGPEDGGEKKEDSE